jgi:hypothetical protein
MPRIIHATRLDCIGSEPFDLELCRVYWTCDTSVLPWHHGLLPDGVPILGNSRFYYLTMEPNERACCSIADTWNCELTGEDTGPWLVKPPVELAWAVNRMMPELPPELWKWRDFVDLPLADALTAAVSLDGNAPCLPSIPPVQENAEKLYSALRELGAISKESKTTKGTLRCETGLSEREYRAAIRLLKESHRVITRTVGAWLAP